MHFNMFLGVGGHAGSEKKSVTKLNSLQVTLFPRLVSFYYANDLNHHEDFVHVLAEVYANVLVHCEQLMRTL